MSSQSSNKILRSCAVQSIKTKEGVVLKRGCIEAKFAGDGIAEALDTILSATAGKGATIEEINDLFAPSAHTSLEKLLSHLLQRGLLISDFYQSESVISPETTWDVFYWHFGQTWSKVHDRLKATRLAVLGINSISRHLINSLSSSGFDNVRIIDHPLLRNRALFSSNGTLQKEDWSSQSISPEQYSELDSTTIDCLIATSDFGFSPVIYEQNQFCLRNHVHFLSVVLNNFIGFAGPLVIPEETACYQCFRRRHYTNLSDHEARQAIEDASFDAQGCIGYHPSMTAVLGSVAAFELTKFYSKAMSGISVGTVVEIDLLAGKMSRKKVLKIPRCPTCSPLNARPSAAVTKESSGARSEQPL